MSKLNVAEIKAKYGQQIPQMLSSIMELGKWVDDVESRLIREGKLKIIDGKYHFNNSVVK